MPMRDNKGSVSGRKRSTVEGPSIQVICLGSGGGPIEDNVSGLLVRATSSKWDKGSILAVDAGSHLAAITNILTNHFPRYAEKKIEPRPPADDEDVDVECPSSPPEPRGTTLPIGPFAGLPFPHASARANAVHLVREHVSTYLITHPHLDHLSGFAINTAAFHNTSRPKRLAALPFTVNAIKNHIFNDVIWPNLTDEENGVGFVTFQRLTEGGNLALGTGQSRGYIEVCTGLAVKGFRVSHGTCASAPAPHPPDQHRRGSLPDLQWHAHHTQQQNGLGARSGSLSSEMFARRASALSSGHMSQPPTPSHAAYSPAAATPPPMPALDSTPPACVVDSSAFFIRAEPSGREILIFGDVEPDSLSHSPRTHLVWAEAAGKIAQGLLAAIFIECSYTDAQPDAVLFGHLAPRHLVAELAVLAALVAERRADIDHVGAKRKRASWGFGAAPPLTPLTPLTVEDGTAALGKRRARQFAAGGVLHEHATMLDDSDALDAGLSSPELTATAKLISPTTTTTTTTTSTTATATPSRADSLHLDNNAASSPGASGPLSSVRVIVIHVKDTMADGEPVGETILRELRGHEARGAAVGRGLGCDFAVSASGESYYF